MKTIPNVILWDETIQILKTKGYSSINISSIEDGIFFCTVDTFFERTKDFHYNPYTKENDRWILKPTLKVIGNSWFLYRVKKKDLYNGKMVWKEQWTFVEDTKSSMKILRETHYPSFLVISQVNKKLILEKKHKNR